MKYENLKSTNNWNRKTKTIPNHHRICSRVLFYTFSISRSRSLVLICSRIWVPDIIWNVSSLGSKKGLIAFSFFITSPTIISFVIKSTTEKTCYTPMECRRLAIATRKMLLRTSKNDATLIPTTSMICLILLIIILITPTRGVSCIAMWRCDSFIGIERNSGMSSCLKLKIKFL